MKTYKLFCFFKLNTFSGGLNNTNTYIDSLCKGVSGDTVLDMYRFLRTLDMVLEGTLKIEYFTLDESQYLEFNLRFPHFRVLFKITEYHTITEL